MVLVRGCRWETASLFLLGGTAYLGLEMAWRGTTHWTMFFAGGLCLCLLRWFDDSVRCPLLAAALLAAGGVSGVELLFGMVCTRLLRLHVWDYSTEWGNVAGLICPKYSFLWFLLCLWLLGGLRLLRWLSTKSPLYRAE